MKTKIAVLMGGRSLEREVSLASGLHVSEALEALGYYVLGLDVTADLVATLRSERPAAAYIALSLSVSINIAARNGRRYLKYLPFVYPVIHGGLGLGFMAEACRLRERRPAASSFAVTNRPQDAGDAGSETPSECTPQPVEIGGAN